MSAYTQILACLDRVAKGRQSSLANFGSGDDFWVKVDAAADEVFENRVKGQYITDIDTELASGGRWSTAGLKRLFSLFEDYFKNDLGYAESGTQPAMAAYLAAVGGGRVPYHAAESLMDALTIGSTEKRLPAVRVFPKGTLVADEADPSSSGMHLFGTLDPSGPTWTAGDGALPTTVGPCGILTIGLGSSQTAGGTFRCTNYVAATYKDIALSLVTAAQYKQTILGSTAVASGVTAGDLAIQVGATTNFTAGEYVLVVEGSVQELVLVDSLAAGPTRLVTLTAIKNAFTTSAVVIPLFRSAAYQSGGSGSGDVAVYALPDRIIAL